MKIKKSLHDYIPVSGKVYDQKEIDYVGKIAVKLTKEVEDYFGVSIDSNNDNWGYNEYEKMFISPNYDSEYFDKLDAKYEEEMEKLREQEYTQEDSNSE
jgi:hypothetical protein